MSLFILLWALAQPGDCTDRTPGLSKCVDYSPRVVDRGVVVEWNCAAVCYTPTTWKTDGGTDAKTLRATGATQDVCRTAKPNGLEAQCAALQRPKGKKK